MTEIEPPRAEYIDNLPADATLGFVFADLYTRGDALVGSMMAGFGLRYSMLNVDQESFVMEPESEALAMETAPEDKMARHIWTVKAGEPFKMRYLFSLTEEGRAGKTLSPAPTDAPISIKGYKGNKTTHGNYYLDRYEGEVVCIVDHVVVVTPEEELFGHPYAHEEPYSGDTRYPLDTKVAELDDYDRKKLRIITTALDAGIIKTSMLHAGADFYEMFDIARPAPPESAKASLLRRVIGR